MPLPAFFYFFVIFFNFTKKLSIRDSGNARGRSNQPLSQSFVPRWGMSLHVRLKVKGIHMSIPVPFTWKYPEAHGKSRACHCWAFPLINVQSSRLYAGAPNEKF